MTLLVRISWVPFYQIAANWIYQHLKINIVSLSWLNSLHFVFLLIFSSKLSAGRHCLSLVSAWQADSFYFIILSWYLLEWDFIEMWRISFNESFIWIIPVFSTWEVFENIYYNSFLSTNLRAEQLLKTIFNRSKLVLYRQLIEMYMIRKNVVSVVGKVWYHPVCTADIPTFWPVLSERSCFVLCHIRGCSQAGYLAV